MSDSQGVEGRWTIHYADDSGDALQGLNALVSGPRVLVADPVVPVVPCDDAAVERGAKGAEREIERRGGGDEFLYGMDDDVREEFLAAVAGAVLRAAGAQQDAAAKPKASGPDA